MNRKSLSITLGLFVVLAFIATFGLIQTSQASAMTKDITGTSGLVVLSTPSTCPGSPPTSLDITRGSNNYTFTLTGACEWSSAFVGTLKLVSGSHWELTFGPFADDGAGTYELDSASMEGTYDKTSGSGPSTATASES